MRRADVVVKVERPRVDEWDWFPPGAGLLCWLHPLVAPPEFLALLQERNLTAIALERVQEDDGSLPILRPASEIAGRMAVQIAGRMLESHAGGRGVLLSGIPGIPPADVVILGAGTLGTSAARAVLGVGARVHLLDHDLPRLSQVDALLQGRAVTALATRSAVEKFVAFADALIGAVHVPGKRAPVLVTEAMVRAMQPGALVLDFSIDQGGCLQTSTLTPHQDYVFSVHGVVHFCAPNVSALVARTASHAINNALLPYLRGIVRRGLPGALEESASLRRAVAARDGALSDELVRS
jgi:alanine dehydrogenase